MTKSSRNNFISKHWRAIALGALCIAVGFACGYAVRRPTALVAQSLRENTDSYSFIHPLLALNRANIDTPTPEYALLARAVENYIADVKHEGRVADASVNFIQYGQSGSFAYNDDAAYYPASLLKVVIMVGYYKKAETDPAILDRQLAYSPQVQAMQTVPFEAPTTLVPGQWYPTSELIERMIVDSDNGAMNILLLAIGDAYLDQVFASLGIPGPTGDGTDYTISAKDYSLFFRVLYNATYLSRENSEKALALLSKVTFKEGLVAGLPEGSIVAHKFGEHVAVTGSGTTSLELHDCGIVYVKGGPYLLCIMTKGSDLDDLKAAIARISELVYDDVAEKSR